MIEEDFDEQYEEYCRRYEEEEDLEHSEEEGYAEPSCSTSGRGSGNYMDDIWLPVYEDSIWQRYTSNNDQIFNGINLKKSFQYSMYYYSLK